MMLQLLETTTNSLVGSSDIAHLSLYKVSVVIDIYRRIVRSTAGLIEFAVGCVAVPGSLQCLHIATDTDTDASL